VIASDVNGVGAIDNVLRITGDAADIVQLQGGWSNAGANSGGIGFQLLTTSTVGDAISLLIDNSVTVQLL
jgi:hypothetical protein